MKEKTDAFGRLLKIMDELRAGCPWDKVQTFESLRHLSIEETYELSDAILEKSDDKIKGELGDLMLHLVFYAKIAEEKGAFNITDVLDGICKKLIQRHPHIYSDVSVANAQEVKSNWEKIKLNVGEKSVLAGVPGSLPSMVKAYRIQEKVSGVGFDWENTSQVFDKVCEELNEFNQEVSNGNISERAEEEFGDLLFALINYARFLKINPDDALEKTNRKFIRRFSYIEQKAKESGKKIQDMSLAEMEFFWNESKKLPESENNQ